MYSFVRVNIYKLACIYGHKKKINIRRYNVILVYVHTHIAVKKRLEDDTRILFFFFFLLPNTIAHRVIFYFSSLIQKTYLYRKIRKIIFFKQFFF